MRVRPFAHEPVPLDPGRRRFLGWCALAAAAGIAGFGPRAAALAPARRIAPADGSVRLLPSVFAEQVAATRGYLLRLSPDRLLHNFRQQAGLAPRAEPYGGWEADTIAGHTLGHYLSALALLHGHGGDADCGRRVDHIVAELRACQAAGGDGYVAGFTRKRDDGTVEGGRAVLDEIERGEIRARPFDLNGSWAPFYTWHKLFAGLLDAHRYRGRDDALEVAVALAAHVERRLAPLDEAQMQELLECEFGGMPESLAELSARSGDARWLALSRRFHHARVLDPLAAGRDELARLHANTQIPKLLGAARQFELDGRQDDAAAVLFFWERVTGAHSYAIGGNSDREYFQRPGTLSRYVTEQTCEHCNTLNMLRLTQHVHAWSGEARQFDFHERALYNHVLSQQHPDGGRYTYMTPLQTGEARRYSEPEGPFWCCVGTGMESHAQFSDAIFRFGDGALHVNLYIPSILDDPAHGLALRLESGLPARGTVVATVLRADAGAPRTIALRLPDWAGGHALKVNGAAIELRPQDGYLRLARDWAEGDRIEADFAMPVRVEPCADDPSLVSLRRGPCVLAADLGPADAPWDGREPLLDPDTAFEPDAGGGARARPPSHPEGLRLAPFHALHERRYAVYFRRLDADGRRAYQAALDAARERDDALARRSLDRLAPGDEDSERAHDLRTEGASHAVVYRRLRGRDARSGGAFEFVLRPAAAPARLRLRYWGEEHRRRFAILADGERLADEALDGGRGDDFVDVDYPLPDALRTPRPDGLRIRIEPEDGYSAGPVFGAWLLP
ncbi:glycoside hydrolase family 127 protein [Luteimonas huabeiensis]|uniref:glycoside hydrolase family 127 protein n=1 Tax=Luteimonas huabeiensis TaxID=1244513 RepID=UPI000467DBC7|nr:glycoside hydrolase family 127 protein [Luteimonas huabeiensis]